MLKAKVTVAFPGVPDGHVYPRQYEVGEEIHGHMAQTAISNGWAEKISDDDKDHPMAAGASLGALRVGGPPTEPSNPPNQSPAGTGATPTMDDGSGGQHGHGFPGPVPPVQPNPNAPAGTPAHQAAAQKQPGQPGQPAAGGARPPTPGVGTHTADAHNSPDVHAASAPAPHIAGTETESQRQPVPDDDAKEEGAHMTIPDNWRDMKWPQQKQLAERIKGGPVANADEAKAAINSELVRRGEKRKAKKS